MCYTRYISSSSSSDSEQSPPLIKEPFWNIIHAKFDITLVKTRQSRGLHRQIFLPFEVEYGVLHKPRRIDELDVFVLVICVFHLQVLFISFHVLSCPKSTPSNFDYYSNDHRFVSSHGSPGLYEPQMWQDQGRRSQPDLADDSAQPHFDPNWDTTQKTP
ncbi:hypothetical protein B0H14DRAFT_2579455 [Mycena olivaceomarginata]|nr:hypothetical protein B0H14DRAFT_2579455 [Mycena olivaceomarginata]